MRLELEDRTRMKSERWREVSKLVQPIRKRLSRLKLRRMAWQATRSLFYKVHHEIETISLRGSVLYKLLSK